MIAAIFRPFQDDFESTDLTTKRSFFHSKCSLSRNYTTSRPPPFRLSSRLSCFGQIWSPPLTLIYPLIHGDRLRRPPLPECLSSAGKRAKLRLLEAKLLIHGATPVGQPFGKAEPRTRLGRLCDLPIIPPLHPLRDTTQALPICVTANRSATLRGPAAESPLVMAEATFFAMPFAVYSSPCPHALHLAMGAARQGLAIRKL